MRKSHGIILVPVRDTGVTTTAQPMGTSHMAYRSRSPKWSGVPSYLGG